MLRQMERRDTRMVRIAHQTLKSRQRFERFERFERFISPDCSGRRLVYRWLIGQLFGFRLRRRGFRLR